MIDDETEEDDVDDLNGDDDVDDDVDDLNGDDDVDDDVDDNVVYSSWSR